MQDEFEAFGLTHAVAVLLSVVSWFVIVRHGRRVRGTDGERTLRRGLVIFIAVTTLVNTAFELLPDVRDPAITLPFHLCDLAWLAALISLWQGDPKDRLVHALVVYWGFGLSAWAFFTPALEDGPTKIRFWLFWLVHWQILVASLLAVFAFDVRPGWASFRRVTLVTFAAFVAATAINVRLRSNYFFSGRYDTSSPVALLGEWPSRLVWLVLIVIGIFALLTVVFRRLDGRRAEASEA